MSHRDLLRAVGARIKAARIAAGMTRRAFAAAAYVSYRTVISWEGGQRELGISTLVQIAALLGVTAGSLLGEDP